MVLVGNLLKERVHNFHTMRYPLQFQFSPVLWAEPLKKKKRVDPSLIREKSERKVRRIAKEIRRHEKVARKHKPLTELEVPKAILKDTGNEGDTRKRPPVEITDEEKARRADILREWAEYKNNQHIAEIRMINRIMASQEKALDELKDASPELYEEALQIDPTLIPFQMAGPVETPPIKNYDHPEGEYVDITKQYLPIVSSEEKLVKRFGAKK